MSGASATARWRWLFAWGCEANGESAHQRCSLEDCGYQIAAIVQRERLPAATKNGKSGLADFSRGIRRTLSV